MSTTKKKAVVMPSMMKTITEVIQVSLRLGQVILRASSRTCRKNRAGLTRRLGAGLSWGAMTAAEAWAWGFLPCPNFPPRVVSGVLFLALSFVVAFKYVSGTRVGLPAAAPLIDSGRSGGTRTPGPRFWRPMLYQLSYTPSGKRQRAGERGALRRARPSPEPSALAMPGKGSKHAKTAVMSQARQGLAPRFSPWRRSPAHCRRGPAHGNPPRPGGGAAAPGRARRRGGRARRAAPRRREPRAGARSARPPPRPWRRTADWPRSAGAAAPGHATPGRRTAAGRAASRRRTPAAL